MKKTEKKNWVEYATHQNEGYALDVMRAVDWCNRLVRAVRTKPLPKKGAKILRFSRKTLRYEILFYPYMGKKGELTVRVCGINAYSGWGKITPILKERGWEINEYANEVNYSLKY